MIYCVEDEASIRELVVYTLHATGYEAQGFADGKAFWAALEQELPELILLDIMLPGEDGLQILKRIRTNSRTADLPVIMVTAKGTEFDNVFIPFANEGDLPDRNAFYVACTRASHSLTISFSAKKITKYLNNVNPTYVVERDVPAEAWTGHRLNNK